MNDAYTEIAVRTNAWLTGNRPGRSENTKPPTEPNEELLEKPRFPPHLEKIYHELNEHGFLGWK